MASETPTAPEPLKSKFEKITIADLAPKTPEPGGSIIVLQCNARDKNNRKLPAGHPDFGTLDQGEDIKTKDQARNFFNQVFASLEPAEKGTVDILVVASNANLITPEGKNSPHKRGLETAVHVLTGAREAMAANTISENQLLNKTGRPIEIDAPSGRLKDLHMLEDSPEFVRFMVENTALAKSFGPLTRTTGNERLENE